MKTPRQTASYARPTCFALLMSANPNRARELISRIQDCDCGVDRVDRPSALTARGGYQHYDLIVVDLDGERHQILDSVQEIRRLETSRAQPAAPIVGISSSDDALADLGAIDRGCTDVIRADPADAKIAQSLSRRLSAALQVV